MPLVLGDQVSPPLAAKLPLALPIVSHCSFYLQVAPLTSVMYPAVPKRPGTKMTYANEIHAVRRVQRKYLWRLVVMSAVR
jgi:hypothetical protein